MATPEKQKAEHLPHHELPFFWDRFVCDCHYYYQYYLCGCPDQLSRTGAHVPSFKGCERLYDPPWKQLQHELEEFEHNPNPPIWNELSVLPFPCYRHLIEARIFLPPTTLRETRQRLMDPKWNPLSAARLNRNRIMMKRYMDEGRTWETLKRIREEEDEANQPWPSPKMGRRQPESEDVAEARRRLKELELRVALDDHKRRVVQLRCGEPRSSEPPAKKPSSPPEPASPPSPDSLSSEDTSSGSTDSSPSTSPPSSPDSGRSSPTPPTKSADPYYHFFPLPSATTDPITMEALALLALTKALDLPPYPSHSPKPPIPHYSPPKTEPPNMKPKTDPTLPPPLESKTTPSTFNNFHSLTWLLEEQDLDLYALDGYTSRCSPPSPLPQRQRHPAYDGYSHRGYHSGAYKYDLEVLCQARVANWSRVFGVGGLGGQENRVWEVARRVGEVFGSATGAGCGGGCGGGGGLLELWFGRGVHWSME